MSSENIEFIDGIVDYKGMWRYPYLGVYEYCFKTTNGNLMDTGLTYPQSSINHIIQPYAYFYDTTSNPQGYGQGDLSIPAFEFEQLKEICPPLSDSENKIIYSMPQIVGGRSYRNPSSSLKSQINAWNGRTRKMYCLLEFRPVGNPAPTVPTPYGMEYNRKPTPEEAEYLQAFFGDFAGINIRYTVSVHTDSTPIYGGSITDYIYTISASSTGIPWSEVLE